MERMEFQADQNLCNPEQNPYENSIELLSRGLVNTYEPPLKNVKQHLEEVLHEQNKILSKLHEENLKLSEVQHSPEIQEMMIKVKTYTNKLYAIKNDMKTLQDRSTKLKKRSEKLQQFSEKLNSNESRKPNSSSKSKEPIIS